MCRIEDALHIVRCIAPALGEVYVRSWARGAFNAEFAEARGFGSSWFVASSRAFETLQMTPFTDHAQKLLQPILYTLQFSRHICNGDD